MGIYVLIFIIVIFAILSMVVRRNETTMERQQDDVVHPQAGLEKEADVDRLILMGHKIEAIKVYRALHAVDLKEAKEAVEKREREIGSR